jgi:hypothetical protein
MHDGLPDPLQAIWAAVLDPTPLATRPAGGTGTGPQRAGAAFPVLDAPEPTAVGRAGGSAVRDPAQPPEALPASKGDAPADPDAGSAKPTLEAAAAAPREEAPPPVLPASMMAAPPQGPAPPRAEQAAAAVPVPPQPPSSPHVEEAAAPPLPEPTLLMPPALFAFGEANPAPPPDLPGEGLDPAALLDRVAAVAAGLAALQEALLALPPPPAEGVAPVPTLPDLPVLPDLIIG